MLKKMKKRFRKQAAVSTVAALTLTGALQTGVPVFAFVDPSVEITAISQNGVVTIASGQTVNFTIEVTVPTGYNVDADVSVDTKYYLKSDGSVISDTPSKSAKMAQNGTLIIPASVTVAANLSAGNITVPIKMTVENATNGTNNKNRIINEVIDKFTVNVISSDTTAPVVTISSPANNGYYKSSALPVSPQYSIVEANSHTELVTGWDNTEGTHTVTVTSTDGSGNVGSASATYTVDNTAPTISTTLVDDGIYNETTLQNMGSTYYSVQDANPGTVSGTLLDTTEGDHEAVITATDKAGNTATETIHYTVDNTAPVITFNFSNNGFYKSSVLSSLNPYYKVTDAHPNPNGVNAPSLNLGEGNQSVKVIASDLAGNSSSTSASYTVDDTAPSVTIKLDPTKYYNKVGLEALGDYYTATDANLLSVNASALVDDQDGTYEATVSAVDKADNETVKTVSYNVDNTVPVIKFNSALQNGGFYQSSALESIKNSFFSATDAHLKNVSDASLDLTEGQHTVTVTATDEAGNETAESITYTIDNTPPQVDFNIPDGGYMTSQDVESLLNGGNYYSESDNIGVVSVVADELNLAEGTHTLTVTVKDAAGNETTKSLTYTIDDTAPTIAFNYPNDWFFKSTNFNVNNIFTATDANLDTAVVTNPQALVTTEGTHTVTVKATDKAGNSTLEDFTYTIDDTVPTIIGIIDSTPNGAGWFNHDVTVSFAAEDALSGIASVTEPNTLGEGPDQTVIGTALDNAGNFSSATVSGINIDKTAPTISGVTDSSPNAAGWYNKDVTVSFSADDALSGIASVTEPVIFGEGASQSSTGTATDKAGNSASTTVSDINIDKTVPTISGAADSSPNAAGWYNHDVTVSFTAIDALSGIASATELVTLGEGTDKTATGIAIDKAGNSASTTVSGINIDKTAPVITINDNVTYTLNQVATWTASDALSGLATPASGTIDTSTPGKHTQTITATDNAGNTVEKTVSYTVVYNYGGILQPIDSDGASVFKAGSTIPVKFQLKNISGNFISTAHASISFGKITDMVLGTVSEVGVNSNANAGNEFRYDPTSKQYIFNLSTKGLTAGTYKISITLDDGTTKTVNVSLR
ncbi:Ig-like domain-containing protein [Neobacillus dielmonensis]|uniref:Ig-like domain-containing protein n=1 Tax=Neobacillus dielmonensis TaxID=1347369 RepID=UPI0005A7F3E8|nr:Ig-like domain-containing protein [Neobacillus dielmonensis]